MTAVAVVVVVSFGRHLNCRHNGNATLENHDRFGRALVDLHRNLSWRCIFTRQSLFRSDVKNLADVGSGVLGCHGSHLDLEPLLEILP
ncbi:hypothetical protein Tco_0296734 [Tanacetum coccineum]